MRDIISIKDSLSILKEYYDLLCFLSPVEQATYHLINRYKHKVSVRLRRKKYRLRCKAKKLRGKEMGIVFDKSNPFLKLIPKNEDFVGGYLVVPFYEK